MNRELCGRSSRRGAGRIEQKVRIHSTPGACQRVVTEIISMAELFGFNQSQVSAIGTALSEALTNAMVHGNCGHRDRAIMIQYSIMSHCVRVRITDEGDGFDHAALRDPTTDDRLSTPGGRGVFLMRRLMDQVRYHPLGNSVELLKRRVVTSEISV